MPRPRSAAARRKVIAAVTELMVERGTGGVTIDEVATRSGVAKTTIYRHWPDRPALVLDAARSHFEGFTAPDTGTLRSDLQAFFGLVHDQTLSGTPGDVMAMVIDAANRDPEMAGIVEQVAAERQEGLEAILERARARGEFDTDLDADELVGVIVGPVVFHKLIRRRAVTERYVETCLDVVLAGLAAVAETRHGDRRSGPRDVSPSRRRRG